MQTAMRDRGSALVMTVLIALALGAAAVTALVPVLGELRERQRARSAADAAALAGVIEGRAAAGELAAANGGVLVGWADDGEVVTVIVRVGERTATARATDSP